MVSVNKLNDVKKVFDENKKYRIELDGRDLNVILSALELPIIPDDDFMKTCFNLHEKIMKIWGGENGKKNQQK